MVPVGLFQMGDCSLIRFFKMLKKLEILPKLAGCRGQQRLCVRLGQEYPPSDHSARRDAAATAIGAVQMLWTAEAVEDLKKLALEGKSASHISAALGVGSRNAVIGKASRIGIKLSGGGGASVRGKGPPRAARPQWATAHYHSAQRRRTTLRRCRRSRSPGLAGGREGGGEELWRSRDRRDATAAVRGHS